MTVEELNRLPIEQARGALERCCGARAWVDAMCAGRPYADRWALLAASDRAAGTLGAADWREAFAHHPKIGDVESLRERFRSTASWAEDEQRGASAASEATLAALAEANRAYEARFGYIFIVCATGKSADEMLALLRARMPNDPDVELRTAAEEQMKITRLRLEKLIS
jgi:2-oxo-4-hydroxy-4-carboxy-5-ureidoimidazoline decarboxylase